MSQLTTIVAEVQRGNVELARTLLVAYLKEQASDVQAWYLLSYLAPTSEYQIRALINVLQRDPAHAPAIKRLDLLRRRLLAKQNGEKSANGLEELILSDEQSTRPVSAAAITSPSLEPQTERPLPQDREPAFIHACSPHQTTEARLPYTVDWTLEDTGAEDHVLPPPDLVEIFFEDVKRLPIISNKSQQFWIGAQLQAPARLQTLPYPRTTAELAQTLVHTHANLMDMSARLEIHPPRIEAWIGELRLVRKDIYRLKRSRPRRFLRQLRDLDGGRLTKDLQEEVYNFVELLCLIPGSALRQLGTAVEDKASFSSTEIITALVDPGLEDEQTLAAHARQLRNDAIKTLSLGFLRYGLRIAKGHVGQNVDFLDLAQEAYLGLLRAAEKYNYREHRQFSHYGTNWIWQHVTRAIADQARTVRIPVHAIEKIRALEKAESIYATGHRALSRDLPILVALDLLTSEEADQLMQPDSKKRSRAELEKKYRRAARRVEKWHLLSHHPYSLDGPAPPLDEESQFQGEWVETLADRLVDQESARFEHDIDMAALRRPLLDLLERTENSTRNLEIMLHRYGFADGEEHTLQEIGTKVGLTRERVRQIEASTLKKLENKLRREDLENVVRASWVDSWLVNTIGLRTGLHYNAHEATISDSEDGAWLDRLLNELPRGEYGQWRTGATREEQLRQALLSLGTVAHYHDVYESLEEEASNLAPPVVYQVMLYGEDVFVPLGEGYFSLVPWEIKRAKEREPILPFAPQPLPDPPGHENAFFEAVLVAHEKLTRSTLTAGQLIEEMLAWCRVDEDVPRWRKQSYLAAFYAVGLIPYASFYNPRDTVLESRLPPLSVRDLRQYCLQTVTKRVTEMPLFWWLLDAYAPARAVELGQLLSDFHSEGIDDSRHRLYLLAGLGAVRRLTYGRYELTPLGKEIAARLGSHAGAFEQGQADPTQDEVDGFTAIYFN